MHFVRERSLGDKKADLIPDFKSIFASLFRCKFIILLSMIVFAMMTFFYATRVVEPTYTAEFIAYVNNNRSTSTIQSLSSNDTDASLSLTLTYAKIIKSRNIVKAALNNSGLEYSYDEVKGAVSSSAETDTQLIDVKVTLASPKDAYDLAMAICKEAPAHMEDIVEGSSMKIVEEPVLPVNSDYPDVTKFVAIGAFMGFALSAGLILLMELLDTRFRSTEDLAAYYKYKVLGDIPIIE